MYLKEICVLEKLNHNLNYFVSSSSTI